MKEIKHSESDDLVLEAHYLRKFVQRSKDVLIADFHTLGIDHSLSNVILENGVRSPGTFPKYTRELLLNQIGFCWDADRQFATMQFSIQEMWHAPVKQKERN